jgi:REP element-mobilizing transposase RayT
MPAKNLLRTAHKGAFIHVYNKGVEERVIFVDEDDYKVFLGFVNEYLSDPTLIESQKKSFTVKGRTYHGTPHKPKNYFKKVSLIAYALEPDHFHLVLHQNAKNILQNFIRSLCTRYSIYYNKKYTRRGALFEGPYKSASITDGKQMVHFLSYLHSSHNKQNSTASTFSSISEANWMSKFADFETAENSKPITLNEYKVLAENYSFDEREKELLASTVIERDHKKLERRVLDKDIASQIVTPQRFKKSSTPKNATKKRRIPEYVGLTIIFFVLFGVGYRNVSIKSLEAQVPATEPIAVDNSNQSAVLAASNTPLPADPNSLIYSYIVVKPGSGTIVVYHEQDLESGAVTTAHEGDHFVAYPVNADWFEIHFSDDTIGYMQSKYIDLEQSKPQ